MGRTRQTDRPAGRYRRRAGLATPLALAAGGAVVLGIMAVPDPAAVPVAEAAPAAASCALGASGSAVKHVIYIQFDGVHYSRDEPDVPSDLEQMPNLLNFITGNGTLDTSEHTSLTAAVANDVVTSETGLYGSGQGVPGANEYNYYAPGGGTHTAGSFAYWTDPVVDYTTPSAAPAGDSTRTLSTAQGKNAPAPWVPYTRDGCNFGSVAAAGTELENTLPDVPQVYGANSAQAKEAQNPAQVNQAAADFMGLAVHCAKGSTVCSGGGVADKLPDEPGGYSGYQALFGNKVIQPVISPSGAVRDLGGTVIKNSAGAAGFPGYNRLTGTAGLAYTLDMQTHGIPVTFTYLSDVHDNWSTGADLGPGTAAYESQARQENAAFGTFFTGLAAAGITKANTLFVFTSDQGDHYVGSAAAPAGCDGITVTCTYGQAGQVSGNLTGMLAAKGVSTAFDVAAGSAPVIYAHGQPGRTTAPVRAMEQAAGSLSAADLATGQTVKVASYLADPVELGLLHMVTGDPKRTGTFALFANPDFSLSSGPAKCTGGCVSEPGSQAAWSQDTVSAQINTTWLGLVGPGVANRGADKSVWSDHADIQPTMMALLGLKDDYTPDGVVLGDLISPAARPSGLRSGYPALSTLSRVYTQLEAPVGTFGLATLTASTRALASRSPGDASYTSIEKQLGTLGTDRDAVAARMQALLISAEFGGKAVSGATANSLIAQGNAVLARASTLAKG